MKNQKKGVRIVAIVLAVVLALSLLLLPLAAYAEEPPEDGVTVLFTHDLHDHLLPINRTDADGVTVSSGGFARLKTAMDRIRAEHDATFTLDAGDFSMGSLFQSIYMTEAPELRTMGAIGIDATTFGNHEYDYGPEGLAAMLTAAKNSGDPLPAIVQANYKTPLPDAPAPAAGQPSLPDAMANYGVKEYTVLSRGGVDIAVFGILGIDADKCAPNSKLQLESPAERAAAVVADIKAREDVDMIVCLSHSGTSPEPDRSEDQLLAAAVPEIDLIISGHTHTVLPEPIRAGDTTIVSCGQYCENLGEVTLLPGENGRWILGSYQLHPINDTLPTDEAVSAKISSFKDLVQEQYLNPYGLTFDQVLATNSVLFTPVDDLGKITEEIGLGNLLADSYRYTIREIEGEASVPVTLSVVPRGVVRSSLPLGSITTSDAFDLLSLGIGSDGSIGYPLVSVYLTGKELEDVAEIDACVSLMMPSARLYTSGVAYTYNPNRIPMDFVTDFTLTRDDGMKAWPADDQLYRVVTDLYSAQMFAEVEALAYGLLHISPKDADGNPITDLTTAILHDQNGSELKAWQSVACYLTSFEKNSDGVSVIPTSYAEGDGRITINDDDSFFAIISNPGATTTVVLTIMAGFLLVVTIITYFLVRRWNRKHEHDEIDHL